MAKERDRMFDRVVGLNNLATLLNEAMGETLNGQDATRTLNFMKGSIDHALTELAVDQAMGRSAQRAS
ncbi:MAG: hypothetical protein LCH46_06055 [Proteobacteria bacterium]|nr:hypothetical protein [Pseudomonadota bacterium]